jgi:hypothetical protein
MFGKYSYQHYLGKIKRLALQIQGDKDIADLNDSSV